MEMKAIERFIDARHSTEGKVVAVALTAMLALSTFTPTALAVADEMDGATVSDKAMETTDRVIMMDEGDATATLQLKVESEHASVLLNGQAVQDAVEVDAEADFSFAVRVDEQFALESVSYNDEVLEAAGTQRTVSTEAVAVDAEDAEPTADVLYVIPADALVDGAVLKVTAVEMPGDEGVDQEDGVESEDSADLAGDESDQSENQTPSVGAAVTDAIAQGVTQVATNAVDRVHEPLITLIEGDAVVVTTTLWGGPVKLGDRTVSVPVVGEVAIGQVLPVTEPVFNFGSDRYVLNGKVGVAPANATPTEVAEISRACNAGGSVTALRVVDGAVQYKTASSDWTALGEGKQLVHFCSTLQGNADTRDKLNIAVEEKAMDALVTGGHGVQVFVFSQNAEEGDEPLFTHTMYFDGGVTELAQGVRFDLGDGVSYRVVDAYISNDSAHEDKAYEAAEALAFRSNGLGADRYQGTTINWPTGTYRAIAVFVDARSYTASYDLNGAEGSVDSFSAVVGEPKTLATDAGITKEGFYLAAWKCLDAAGNQLGIYEPGASFTMPAHNVVLQAQWESYDGDMFFTARFVWQDEDGKDVEIERRTVTELNGEQVTVTTEVSTDLLECPRGYAYAQAGNAPQVVGSTGRVITFRCERQQYQVQTQYYSGDTILSVEYSTAGNHPYFGTTYSFVAPKTRTFDDTNYVFDERDSRQKLSITVSDNAEENIVKAYYARDVMGVEDPNKPDGIPDKYQVLVKFAHDENSVWADGSEEAQKSAVVNRYNADGELAIDGVGHLTEDQIPALIQTDGLLLDDACNWPTTATDITAPVTFLAKYTMGNFRYLVRYVADDGAVLATEEGTAGFGGPIPYDMDRQFEGYAFDTVENKNGVITSEAPNNVVTVRYGVDRTSVANPNEGDGIPDKYQATAVYAVQHGTWDNGADSKTVVVTLNEWNGSEWAPLGDDQVQLQLPIATSHYGYEPNSGAWDVKPGADTLKGGATTEFTYTFAPIEAKYTVIYCKDSTNGEVLGPQQGWAGFGTPVPVLVEQYRPAQGFSGEPTYVGTQVMTLDEEKNVLYVVYNRDAYTVRGVFAEGSHGTIRGNATQSVLYNRDSETMTFVADEGYRIASVVVNGESQPVANGQTSYDFKIRRVSKDSTVVVRTAHMDEVVIEAPSRSKVYDGTALGGGEPQITGVPEGFTATARVAGSRTNAGVTATTVDPASIKIVDASGTDVTQNFRTTTVDGTLTVEQARAIVTVNNASKPAGTSDPEFTGQVAGLVEGDALKGLSYMRTVAGEMAGVYLNALTAEFEYNPNYNVTVVPGTFTIGDTTLIQNVGSTSTPSGMNPGPRGGSIETVYRTASSVDALARVMADIDDFAEPVYADVVFDDSVPMVTRTGETIEDDATALGAFDEPKCWAHWVMAMGLLLTIAYAVVVVARRLGYARKASELDDNLTGGHVAASDSETVRSSAHHVGA